MAVEVATVASFAVTVAAVTVTIGGASVVRLRSLSAAAAARLVHPHRPDTTLCQRRRRRHPLQKQPTHVCSA